jgi:hypothetical protein
MNVKLLIDAVVRQTTVLIAQMATAAGIRAPLSHVANQVFLDLARELESQGVGRKVIADMFGLALRSYQLKVQRLEAGGGSGGETLWEAVFAYVREQEEVLLTSVLRRFHRDEEAIVRGILRDLCDSGLLYRSGRGTGTAYRARSPEEVRKTAAADRALGVDPFVWLSIYLNGPLSRDALADVTGLEAARVDEALDRLVGDGRVDVHTADGVPRYRARHVILPIESPAGWEAAVLDHFQAMVGALVSKLRGGEARAMRADEVGGSTWSFDVWPGHPLEADARGLLGRVRADVSALRRRVTEHNDAHPPPRKGGSRVVFYAGQNVLEETAEDYLAKGPLSP